MEMVTTLCYIPEVKSTNEINSLDQNHFNDQNRKGKIVTPQLSHQFQRITILSLI